MSTYSSLQHTTLFHGVSLQDRLRPIAVHKIFFNGVGNAHGEPDHRCSLSARPLSTARAAGLKFPATRCAPPARLRHDTSRKTLAKYAYESRAGKPAPSFTKAHFEDINGKVLMSYSAIELNDDDEPAPEPDEPITLPPQVRGDDGFKVSPRERADEPARSSKKRRSKSKDG